MTKPTAPSSLVSRTALIGGLEVFRVVCQPTDADDTPLRWAIGSMQVRLAGPGGADGPAPLGLFGDLFPIQDGQLVGATARIMFAPDTKAPDTTIWVDETPEGLNKITEHFAGWATHVLWDTASSAARTVIALCGTTGSIELPHDTPPHDLILVQTDED